MEKIFSCKKCLMPSSRPRITFDKNQICNGCKTNETKKKIDWSNRKKEFLDICDKYRSKNGNYDCIVPWSGGKDSSSIAYKLKFEFNMNPLLVTFSPLIPIIISPLSTNLYLSPIITKTKITTISIKTPTPNKISFIIYPLYLLNLNTI